MYPQSLMHVNEVYSENKKELSYVVEFFSFLLQRKSKQLAEHSLRVSDYAGAIAARMGLSHTEINTIQAAGILHDIGLLNMPYLALQKRPFLTTRERASYRRHPEQGAAMLELIPSCQEVIPCISHHHERWDGTGFPRRRKQVNIPQGARIIAVADYYDHLIYPTDRNVGKTKREAVSELYSASGLLFDPTVVRSMIDVLGH